jgi:hypothetical protein
MTRERRRDDRIAREEEVAERVDSTEADRMQVLA